MLAEPRCSPLPPSRFFPRPLRSQLNPPSSGLRAQRLGWSPRLCSELPQAPTLVSSKSQRLGNTGDPSRWLRVRWPPRDPARRTLRFGVLWVALALCSGWAAAGAGDGAAQCQQRAVLALCGRRVLRTGSATWGRP